MLLLFEETTLSQRLLQSTVQEPSVHTCRQFRLFASHDVVWEMLEHPDGQVQVIGSLLGTGSAQNRMLYSSAELSLKYPIFIIATATSPTATRFDNLWFNDFTN